MRFGDIGKRIPKHLSSNSAQALDQNLFVSDRNLVEII